MHIKHSISLTILASCGAKSKKVLRKKKGKYILKVHTIEINLDELST